MVHMCQRHAKCTCGADIFPLLLLLPLPRLLASATSRRPHKQLFYILGINIMNLSKHKG